MATYVVGDLQGCLSPLWCLLEKVAFDTQQDKLIIAGDTINRGPDSLQTLRFLYANRKYIKTVLGNHDLHLLAVAHGFSRLKNGDTIKEILSAKDKIELLEWLIHQPLIYTPDDYNCLIVHAGISPFWGVNKAKRLAAEVEQILQSENASIFFKNMYGDEPNIWSDNLEGMARLRVITNYLTRVRLLNAQGALNLSYKGGIDTMPAGLIPWFLHPKQRFAKKTTIVFGHWAALNGYTGVPHAIALDTGCVWGQKLTMICLDTNQLYSCQCHH